jgi:hypothetical protein
MGDGCQPSALGQWPRVSEFRTSQQVCNTKIIIARLDRANQISGASMMDREALEYWATRFKSGGDG